MNPLRCLLVAAALLGATASAFAQRTEIANAAQPQLTTGSDGHVWLVYGQLAEAPSAPVHDGEAHAHQGHPQPSGRAGDVFVANSTDGGVSFSPAVKVAQVPQLMLGMRRGPRIAASGNRITVTVVGKELLAFSSTDAGKTWSEPVTINDVATSAREGLHDLASGNGTLFVTWLDMRNGKMELWSATSPDGGRSWAKNQQVYKSPDKSICECCHPTALFDTGGNLAVMWRNSVEGSRDMWMTTRLKDAAGFTPAKKLGKGTWKLNACPMDGGRIVALGGGKFGTVFQRAGEVFLARGEGAEVSLGNGKQPVAITGQGQTFVMWQDGADLVSVRNLTGITPSKAANDARFPSLVASPNGKGALFAYERGPKGATSIVVERL